MEMETPTGGDWKIGRKEPVRAFIENSWHRGFAAKKKGQEFEVFLLDIGKMVTVSQENLQRLPDELMQVPPIAYQVKMRINVIVGIKEINYFLAGNSDLWFLLIHRD